MITSTTNGSYSALKDLDAAEAVAKDAQLYQLFLEGGAETTRGLVPGLSAASAIVSAFCGVAGLRGKGHDEPGEMEIDIMNNTPYTLAPATVYSQDFGFQEAARLMPSGEKTTIKGCTAVKFQENKSYIKMEFLIGNSSPNFIRFDLKIMCGNLGRWVITDYTIDDHSGNFSQEDNEIMQYIGFQGKDASWPSFSLHLLPNRYMTGGKSNLIFYPTTK